MERGRSVQKKNFITKSLTVLQVLVRFSLKEEDGESYFRFLGLQQNNLYDGGTRLTCN